MFLPMLFNGGEGKPGHYVGEAHAVSADSYVEVDVSGFTINANDLLLAFYCSGSATGMFDPSGFTEIESGFSGTSGPDISKLYYKVAAGTETTITAGSDGNGSASILTIVILRGDWSGGVTIYSAEQTLENPVAYTAPTLSFGGALTNPTICFHHIYNKGWVFGCILPDELRPVIKYDQIEHENALSVGYKYIAAGETEWVPTPYTAESGIEDDAYVCVFAIEYTE